MHSLDTACIFVCRYLILGGRSELISDPHRHRANSPYFGALPAFWVGLEYGHTPVLIGGAWPDMTESQFE
jgi:hypothetical protein